ncbi:MAG TPA: hypothetical protein VM783_17985 [Candidatus Acidoferrum sp.]|nr:hypothetical protein [Candidatus Acidoferrum sp.]
MRKHNRTFAQRYTRDSGDRSNFPQHMAHTIANDKRFHFMANTLLRAVLARA